MVRMVVVVTVVGIEVVLAGWGGLGVFGGHGGGWVGVCRSR